MSRRNYTSMGLVSLDRTITTVSTGPLRHGVKNSDSVGLRGLFPFVSLPLAPFFRDRPAIPEPFVGGGRRKAYQCRTNVCRLEKAGGWLPGLVLLFRRHRNSRKKGNGY
ncbi:MAG: hypothetical protein JO356_18070 [Acidobacteria bacterium]|nr:hypothetical protein [Acidobacteriota bacterium]